MDKTNSRPARRSTGEVPLEKQPGIAAEKMKENPAPPRPKFDSEDIGDMMTPKTVTTTKLTTVATPREPKSPTSTSGDTRSSSASTPRTPLVVSSEQGVRRTLTRSSEPTEEMSAAPKYLNEETNKLLLSDLKEEKPVGHILNYGTDAGDAAYKVDTVFRNSDESVAGYGLVPHEGPVPHVIFHQPGVSADRVAEEQISKWKKETLGEVRYAGARRRESDLRETLKPNDVEMENKN